jgi:hypothetical protein
MNNETFIPSPAGFHFAPVYFTDIGSSLSTQGLIMPQWNHQHQWLTRRMLASSALAVERPSREFPGGIEQIRLDRGVPVRSQVTLNGAIVSVTDFENGRPITQLVDSNFDGRMDTRRRFRAGILGTEPYLHWDEFERRMRPFANALQHLLEWQESDFAGTGVFRYRETYLQDGSVVYLWDFEN